MKSKIEWTDRVWNPIRGCSRVSRGCENCYAERQAARFSGPGMPYEGLVRRNADGAPRWTGLVARVGQALEAPLRWKKPGRVFVNSMSDLFHPAIPDAWIDRIFGVMALCPEQTFIILTKRIERARDYFAGIPGMPDEPALRWALIEGAAQALHHERTGEDPSAWLCVHEPLPNVQLGVSAEDQETWDERVDVLATIPAAVRVVSLEPLLSSVDMGLGQNRPSERIVRWHRPLGQSIHQVIVGGESGPGARPCDIGWIRSVVRQCREAGVACFVKQLGSQPRGWCSARLLVGHRDDDRASTDYCDRYEGDEGALCPSRCWLLRSPKCGNPEEWPEDLRVRELR